MFISNIHGKESVNDLAKQLGCKTGEVLHASEYALPALAGNTFVFKDQLKAAGARWNGANKAWVFSSWQALESALIGVLAAQ